ncbi:MAG TPA: sodium/solute symporter [Candidatus Hydrogenedentes bacterium]|nr:sodium/solute symporter [Candidatus Hydrogenedentota bacterium]HPG66122.1 sodium/solute symporter [Candidatus Hydrogenedentota bacterium]
MQGFTWIDTTVLAAYLVGIAVLGSVLGRGQKDVGDYFLGGRTFHWLPIALSVIATDLSAITYMGSPALAFQKDLRYMLVILTVPVAVLITVPIVVSVFYRLKIFTIYEYLERRYSIVLRVLASILFLAMRGGWLATAIFVPSLALSVVTHANMTICIFGTGLFATFYAAVGGFKGVIWCDVVQFFILVGGVIVAAIAIIVDFQGDVAGIWTLAAEQGRTRILDLDYHLVAEYTVWSVLAGGIVSNMSAAGADQVTVQRYLSARSLRIALKSALAQSLIVIPVVIPMFLLGTFLAAYYTRHPEMMQSLLALAPADPIKAMDRVLPHFVVHALPTGVGGLVIAGIIAATMSSLDAGMNSLATVAVMDYYKRFFHRESKNERHYLWVSRGATVFFGLSATIAALYVGQLGTIIEIIGKIGSLLVGPLVAMFFLGVLTRRANTVGVFLGTLIGLGVTAWVAHSTQVFWSWYGPVGLAASGISGYAISFVWQVVSHRTAFDSGSLFEK